MILEALAHRHGGETPSIGSTHQAVSGGSSSQLRYELITGRRSCSRGKQYCAGKQLNPTGGALGRRCFSDPKACLNEPNITKLYRLRNVR